MIRTPVILGTLGVLSCGRGVVAFGEGHPGPCPPAGDFDVDLCVCLPPCRQSVHQGSRLVVFVLLRHTRSGGRRVKVDS